MTTSSEEGTQGELLIVHLKVADPMVNPVTPEVGLRGLVIAAVPETKDQVPEPTMGLFAAKVAVLVQIDWSMDAFASVGGCIMLTLTFEGMPGQPATVTVTE